MLLRTAEKRWKVKAMCAELRRILAQSQARPREHVPQEAMDAVLAVDQAALSKVTRPELLEEQSEDHQHLKSADARQIRKSKRLDLPLMKTPQDSQGRKSALPPPVLDRDEPLQEISEKPPVEMSLPSARERSDCNPPNFQTPFPKRGCRGALQGSGHTLSCCFDPGCSKA